MSELVEIEAQTRDEENSQTPRKLSVVYKYFNKLSQDDNWYHCLTCQKKCSQRSDGTSNLIFHLKQNHSDLYTEYQKQSQLEKIKRMKRKLKTGRYMQKKFFLLFSLIDKFSFKFKLHSKLRD